MAKWSTFDKIAVTAMVGGMGLYWLYYYTKANALKKVTPVTPVNPDAPPQPDAYPYRVYSWRIVPPEQKVQLPEWRVVPMTTDAKWNWVDKRQNINDVQGLEVKLGTRETLIIPQELLKSDPLYYEISFETAYMASTGYPASMRGGPSDRSVLVIGFVKNPTDFVPSKMQWYEVEVLKA